jgi:hypothetical protein
MEMEERRQGVLRLRLIVLLSQLRYVDLDSIFRRCCAMSGGYRRVSLRRRFPFRSGRIPKSQLLNLAGDTVQGMLARRCRRIEFFGLFVLVSGVQFSLVLAF